VNIKKYNQELKAIDIKKENLMIRLTIDNRSITVPDGTTILNAAKKLGIRVPTLCYDPRLVNTGACRICSVEVNGRRDLVPACSYPVQDKMEVITNSERVREARKTIVELLVANHPPDCLVCVRNNKCELQDLAIEYGLREWKWQGDKRDVEPDTSTVAIVREPDKCVLCGKCVKVCRDIQGVYALDFTKRGFYEIVEPAFHKPLAESVCILCGQCLLVCPTAAITDKSMADEVQEKLDDPNVYCIAQTAPVIRASIGEEFGMEPGELVTGKLVSGLKMCGFDQVFDTDFGADMAVMEEGYEFIERLKNDGPFPMFTSCCPGWIKFMEHFYPEFIPNMSSCKSPQQITGTLSKTYFAEKMNIDPKKIYMVAIMPCSAKKFEIERPEMYRNDMKDVDAVLTTRETAQMFRMNGIDNSVSLPSTEYDAPLGITSGAGVIFGVTGGMMEAALRTVSEKLSGEIIEKIEFKQLRGFSGIKEGTALIGDTELKFAVAHGLGNVRKVLDRIKRGEAEYHFIEVMACPGGCVGGGGQPIPTNVETIRARIQAVYNADRRNSCRKSHENPAVREIYETFLPEGPLGKKSHKLLHTEYKERYPKGV